jgi:preprotein translocase subunit SecA
MQWLIRKIVGTKNERDVKKMRPLVAKINQLEEDLQKLSDDQLKAKTVEFKERLAKGETLADIELEAFAVVKNASRRLCGTVAKVCDHTLTWEMVPFDVQLIGGLALHYGKIAEMATGEGKTLVATMPAYLNALTGAGVHVVTVNDYLARRDAEWMGLVYKFLGLTVGCIQSQMDPATRRQQYACDITYGTNSEFGFDYLRDMGMAYRPEDQVQRGHAYAIVDEIDSILIDEARTPLIISGPAPYSTQQYVELKPIVERLVRKQRELCNQIIQDAKKLIDEGNTEEAMQKLYQANQAMPKHPQLQRLLEDASTRRLLEKIDAMMLTDMHKEHGRELREELYFIIEERHNDASLTDKGCEALSPNDPDAYLLPDIVSAMSELDGDDSLSEEAKFEKRQAIQDAFARKSERIHAVDQLIRAYALYEKDVQYVVQNNQVVIVDENTGRLMSGRRWSDGLHQAVEAKEGVKIERETQTLATITIQNYFRLYKKLSGMTGTAETEADEFHQIYKLDVMVIPTNRPVRRMDYNDFIYKTQREKYNALIEEISDCHQRGQPVLVGTISVENSEVISRMLRRVNIPHNVLNAKNHQREAEIVANAGQAGAVTIATNMAGRGTDIKLGKGVVHIERDVITSQASLETKIEGKTLRQLLTEKPAGLHVIGSERHESRRIDRQLRGRCARQGDPGASRFYVSLEDDLMRIFGSDRISKLMDRLGIEEGEVMEHAWLNKSIERAQRRVEQHNFSIRKRTLDYDDVMNKQREIIYGFRSEVLQSEKVSEPLLEVATDVIYANAESMVQPEDEEGVKNFIEWVNTKFPVGLKRDQLPEKGVTAEAAAELVAERVKQAYEVKIKVEDPNQLASMERYIILNAIDNHWQEYLRGMDALRQGVGLRAYGQRDPLVEYKKEAYTMFSDLMDKIKSDVTDRMFRAATSMGAFQSFLSALPRVQAQHASFSALGGGAGGAGGAGAAAAPRPVSQQEAAMQAALASKPQPVKRDIPKVGRNEPCPCGSGKKYKHCHGA